MDSSLKKLLKDIDDIAYNVAQAYRDVLDDLSGKDDEPEGFEALDERFEALSLSLVKAGFEDPREIINYPTLFGAPQEQGQFAEAIEFAGRRKRGPKNCIKGLSCGDTCLPRYSKSGKATICSKMLSPEQAAQHKALVGEVRGKVAEKKAGGGGGGGGGGGSAEKVTPEVKTPEKAVAKPKEPTPQEVPAPPKEAKPKAEEAKKTAKQLNDEAIRALKKVDTVTPSDPTGEINREKRAGVIEQLTNSRSDNAAREAFLIDAIRLKNRGAALDRLFMFQQLLKDPSKPNRKDLKQYKKEIENFGTEVFNQAAVEGARSPVNRAVGYYLKEFYDRLTPAGRTHLAQALRITPERAQRVDTGDSDVAEALKDLVARYKRAGEIQVSVYVPPRPKATPTATARPIDEDDPFGFSEP